VGLLTVFYAPEKLFAEQGKEGKWLLPFVAALLTAAIVAVAMYSVADMGAIVRTQLESNPRLVEMMGQQRIDEAVRDAGTTAAKIKAGVFSPIFTAVTILILSGIMFAFTAIADAGATFKKVLTVCAYATFAYGLVQGVGGLVVLALMSDTSTADVYHLIQLSPALFLDRNTTSKALYSLIASFDLLNFWRFFLIGLGVSKVSAKLSLGKALAMAVVPWALFTLLGMGFASIF